MTLGALRLDDLRTGNIQPWSWKREGIALSVDVVTIFALGVLASLVATGILPHFPVGSEVIRNPYFWTFLGAAGAILIWDAIICMIRKQPTPAATEIHTNEIWLSSPIITIPSTTRVISNIPEISSDSSQTILISHMFAKFHLDSDRLNNDFYIINLCPFQLEIKMQGQWEAAELKEMNLLFRDKLWSDLEHRDFIFWLHQKNILNTKFDYGDECIHVDTTAFSNANLPLLTCKNENAAIIFTAYPAQHLKNDGRSWSITPIEKGSWFNAQKLANLNEPCSLFHLNIDTLRKIFDMLPFKSQVRLAASCRYFTELTCHNTQWYQCMYLPSHALLNEISLGENLSCFQHWAKVCAANGARSLYADNSTDAPSLWDLQDWLPTVWPKGEICVCGEIQGVYFYSIGLNITLEGSTTWGALTAFCMIDYGHCGGLLMPNLCVEIGDDTKNHIHTYSQWPNEQTLRGLAQHTFQLFATTRRLLANKESAKYKVDIASP